MTYSTMPAYRPLLATSPKAGENPETSVNRVMEELARNHASSDVFYADYWNVKFCKDSQCLSQADETQAQALTTFAENFKKYSPEKLAERFKSLYVRAYHEEKGLMLLGHDDASVLAKSELDLWTGLVDYLAIRDIDFFYSISSDVWMVETLNSPNMSAYHRGLFHQLLQGMKSFSDVRQEYLDSLALDKPLDPSYLELETAVIFQGGDEVEKILHRPPSEVEVNKILDKLDPQRALWNSLKAFTSEDPLEDIFMAIADYTDGVADSQYATWIQSPHFLSVALLKMESAGVSFNSYVNVSIEQGAREQNISPLEGMLTLGTKGDLRRGLLAWPEALEQKTNTHLDDYLVRKIYVNFIKAHYSLTLEDLQKSVVHPTPNRIVVQAMKFSVTMEDIKAIRNQVKPQYPLDAPRVALWDYLKDSKDQQPLVLTPDMLPSEMLNMAEGIKIQGQSVKDHLQSNIDYIVFLPDELYTQFSSESVAHTFSPYKIVFVKKKDSEIEKWYPSTLLATLAHEAAHDYYDNHVKNILETDVESERFANVYGLNVLENIPLESLPFQEMERVVFETAITKGRISAANHVLGLDPNNRNLEIYDIPNVAEQYVSMHEAFQKADTLPVLAKTAFDALPLYLGLVSVPKFALGGAHKFFGKSDLDQMIKDRCGLQGASNREKLEEELFRKGRFAFSSEGISIFFGLDGIRNLTMISDEKHSHHARNGLLEVLASWGISQNSRNAGMMGRIPHWSQSQGFYTPYQERLATVNSHIQCNKKVVENPAVEVVTERSSFSDLPAGTGIPVDIKHIGRDSLAIFAGVHEAAKIHSTPLQQIQGMEHLERVPKSFVVSPSITTYTMTPLVTAIKPLVVRPTFIVEPAAVMP